MVLVQILAELCKVENRVWDCADEALAERLNDLEDTNREGHDIGSDPDPDLTSARLMIGMLGGEILEADPPPPLADPEDELAGLH